MASSLPRKEPKQSIIYQMTTTDTPRTDADYSQLDDITNNHVIRALRIFGRERITKDRSLESWITLGAHRLEEADAEVERLRANLRRAVEIAVNLSYDYADTEYDDELDQLKATLNRTTEESSVPQL